MKFLVWLLKPSYPKVALATTTVTFVQTARAADSPAQADYELATITARLAMIATALIGTAGLCRSRGFVRRSTCTALAAFGTVCILFDLELIE